MDRELSGEIRAEKPQEVFGDFCLSKEGGSRSQMVVDPRACGWLLSGQHPPRVAANQGPMWAVSTLR